MVRKDYKYLLVDAGRSKEEGLRHKVRKDDRLSTKAPMRNYKGRYWSPRDYLNPLYRCLERQVGRPWNKVFSELCKSADSKSLQGLHLRSHIFDIVVLNHDVKKTKDGYRRRQHFAWKDREWTTFSRNELFVDDQGILRKPKAKEMTERRKSWSERKKELERWFRRLSPTSAYIFFSESWWYVEWQNYNPNADENSLRNTPWLRCKKFLVINYETNQYELINREGYTRDFRYTYRTQMQEALFYIFPTLKKQLSRREIKDNRLT